MIATTTDVRLDLELDFGAARARWIDARRSQREKDTPGSRAAVTANREEIDRVLDLYLELSRAPLR